VVLALNMGASFAELAMGVHVDRPDPFAADHDRQFLPFRLLGMRFVQETAATKDDAGGGARLQKMTTRGHDNFSKGSR
jgi:hypothetical protein